MQKRSEELGLKSPMLLNQQFNSLTFCSTLKPLFNALLFSVCMPSGELGIDQHDRIGLGIIPAYYQRLSRRKGLQIGHERLKFISQISN